MVDEIVVGFEDPRVLKAGEPEARLWSSLPNREPVAHQNPGAMVSEPTRRASWVRHVESDSPPSGNRPRVTISGTRYKWSGRGGLDLLLAFSVRSNFRHRPPPARDRPRFRTGETISRTLSASPPKQ